jgi:hypothetical protein
MVKTLGYMGKNIYTEFVQSDHSEKIIRNLYQIDMYHQLISILTLSDNYRTTIYRSAMSPDDSSQSEFVLVTDERDRLKYLDFSYVVDDPDIDSPVNINGLFDMDEGQIFVNYFQDSQIYKISYTKDIGQNFDSYYYEIETNDKLFSVRTQKKYNSGLTIYNGSFDGIPLKIVRLIGENCCNEFSKGYALNFQEEQYMFQIQPVIEATQYFIEKSIEMFPEIPAKIFELDSLFESVNSINYDNLHKQKKVRMRDFISKLPYKK